MNIIVGGEDMNRLLIKMKERKNYTFFILKYTAVCFAVFSVAFILLRFPEKAGRGVSEGINLCIYTLIPSLFPFTVLANFCVESGLTERKNKLLGKITRLLFKLPSECASVIFFSLVGGLPVGAKMTQSIYEKGIITKKQGQRLLLFCMNPGPAFAVSYVGYKLLGSKEMGMIIYLSVILSSLLLGFLTRFIFEDECEPSYSVRVKESNFSSAFYTATVKGAKTLFEVCAWVILFSCINSLTEYFGLSDGTLLFVKSISEMTQGCKIASESLGIPAIAGIIAFGGICAHFQVSSALIKLKLPYKYFLCARIIASSFAVIICKGILCLVPVASETISLGTKPVRSENPASFFLSVMMILMSVLFLIGDDYKLKRKEKSISKKM